MCHSYGEQFEVLAKDKEEISNYLMKQIESKQNQLVELNDRFLGLQKTNEREKRILEKNLVELKEKSQLEIETLEKENLFLSERSFAARKCRDDSFSVFVCRKSTDFS